MIRWFAAILLAGTASASAQQVTISNGLGCQSYEAFEKIYAFVKAGNSAAGDRFIASETVAGRCVKFPGTVMLKKRGIFYSKVMTGTGAEYWVIAQAVE